MKNSKRFPSMLSIAFVIACLSISALGQSNDQLATPNSSGSSVRWDIKATHSAATLTVLGPDGEVFTKEFQGGNVPEFRLINKAGERLPDGQYSYELRLTPIFAAGVKEALKAAREKGNEGEVQRELKRRGQLPTQPLVQSGGFSVVNGIIVVAGGTENSPRRAMVEQPATPAAPATPVVSSASSGRINYKVQRHHPRFLMFDQVIPDDLIVQGSVCAGLDCVNGEVFGFDTIRTKENNTRIQFDDTSTSAGFATNNWQIRANSSASGGASFLAFVDQGATGNSETGTIVFEVDAGAPANSLKVASSGNVGLGTATPVLDMHANTTDTPALRLEQNNTGGFTAQTWDIGANEANFFVRDVTSGSTLPLRIRPGAPTSSVDIAANGFVGIGTGSPDALLQVEKNQATGTEIRVDNNNTTNGFAGIYFNGGFAVASGGLVQYNNVTGQKNLFVPTGGADPVHFGTNNTVRMTILPANGFVGIATQAPTDNLSVNGTASKTGGGSWSVFSDERLKTIKGRFNRGLKAAMQLQPIRYEYKSDNALGLKAGTENIGFGAQQLQQVIPEAVTTNSNGYLQVNNDPIIWTMLNAIKEQQQEIQKLKKEIRQLRASRRRK